MENLEDRKVGATLCGRPNNPDKIIVKWLLESENKFKDIKIDEYMSIFIHTNVK